MKEGGGGGGGGGGEEVKLTPLQEKLPSKSSALLGLSIKFSVLRLPNVWKEHYNYISYLLVIVPYYSFRHN